jgi:hypothetical protein
MFLMQGLSRQIIKSHMGRNIWVPAFKDDNKLKHKRAIHLKKTEHIRRSYTTNKKTVYSVLLLNHTN